MAQHGARCKGLKLSDRYTAPPMPFGLSPDEAVALAGRIPGVRPAHDGRTCHRAGPPLEGWTAWQPLDRLGFCRRNRPSYTLLEFWLTA